MRVALCMLTALALCGCMSNVEDVPRAEAPVPARTPDPMAVEPQPLAMDDAEIHEQVHAALANEPHLAGQDVRVHVDDGDVHLSGTVASAELRALARTLAEDVAGVGRVHVDDLRVR